MKSLCFSFFVLMCVGASAETRRSAADGDVRLHGPLAERLSQMVSNHLKATDVDYLTAPFRHPTERSRCWQSEFWGKYMHAAAPFCRITGDRELRAKVDRGVETILSAQGTDGYIGNYPTELRCGGGWDVWGMKYTMLGLLHYYDLTGDARALKACQRLCDYLIDELGPKGKRGVPLYKTGYWCGLASSSVLEPVVWLYRRTDERRYLAFADYIVKGMTEPQDGPRLVDLALQGITPADRNGRGNPSDGKHGYVAKHDRRKAYEMMSCYQGLLEYYEVTGREELLNAAVATVAQILRDEINVAGGCSAGEAWYHGAAKQHLTFAHQQETCVLTTWMRLLEKLLSLTGRGEYADEIERTFCNAYLASLNGAGSEFAAYTPLSGTRFAGHHHCFMHTNCCNANGPRGFLTFLRTLLQAEGNSAYLNFYASATADISLATNGERVSLEVYTLYPQSGLVRIVNHSPNAMPFVLALRIPAWSRKTSAKLNGKVVAVERALDGYWHIDRMWKPGDVVELNLDLAVRMLRQEHSVAFVRGPIALSRDTRFEDGLVDEVLRSGAFSDGVPPEFTPVRRSGLDMRMIFSTYLPLAQHDTNPDGKLLTEVKFCDFASAGNEWSRLNGYCTWLPILYSATE